MSTARRGKGEGTISQRKSDGRWMARVDMGRDEHGRRQRRTAYGHTRAECATELAKLLGQSATGELLTTSTPTVSRLLDDWFAAHQDEWKPGTQRVYRCAIREWLRPALGTMRLEKLKPVTIQRWINEASKDGGRAKVILAHTVLRAALKFAMHQRLVTFNSAALCKVPRPRPKPITPLSVEQSQQLIAAAADHRLGALVVTALATGMRIGEVSGLKWSDVDMATSAIRIRQQVQANGGSLTIEPLKTDRSRRDLVMPSIVADAMKGQRTRQLQERLRAGATWNNAHDLIFTRPNGQPLNPGVIRKALHAILKTAGLDRIKFHTLRHSAATLLLADGAQLFDVSRVLGHAQVSTTADVYGHLVRPMAAGAAARMDALLKKA